MQRSWNLYGVVPFPPLGLGRRRGLSDEQASFRDKDPWHAQGHYLVMDGLWIFHHDRGQGAPLILLHGTLTSSYLYRESLPLLAEQYRVIAPDLPGFGYSSKPERPDLYRVAGYADFLEKFLDLLELKQVAIVAQDYSGWAGIELARQHPQRVSHLVVLNLPLAFPAWLSRGQGRPLRTRWLGERLGDLWLSKGWLKRTLRGWVDHKEGITEDLLEHYYWPLTDGTRWVILALARELGAPFRGATLERGEARELRAPTLLLEGGSAVLRQPAPGEGYELGFPNAKRVVLEGAGHLLPEDQPEEVARLILDFVGAG